MCLRMNDSFAEGYKSNRRVRWMKGVLSLKKIGQIVYALNPFF